MEFKQIKASEIVDFAHLCVNSGSGLLPITPWRALSQSTNPAVHPDDTLLVVAYDSDENIRGYIGILPSGSTSKRGDRIFWNSCWWVDPKAGAMVSMNLLSRFLLLTEKRVAFSDMTQTTQEILERLGGFQLSHRKGILLRIRSGYHKRAESKKNLHPLIQLFFKLQLLRLIDGCVNLFQHSKLRKFQKHRDEVWRHRWYEHMDPKHEKFIAEHSDSKMEQVDRKQYDWWEKYPWLADTGKENRAIEKRYYFSSLSKEFTTRILEVTLDEQILGLAICTINNGVVKTHYLWYLPENEDRFFKALIDALIADSSTHTIISFHTGCVDFLRGCNLPSLSSAPQKRYFGYSNSLSDEISENDFQDGAGDYIFT